MCAQAHRAAGLTRVDLASWGRLRLAQAQGLAATRKAGKSIIRPMPPRYLERPPPPDTTRGIADVLAGTDALASLGRRLRESQARLEAVLPLLAAPMRAHVRAGPIDDEGWTLLAGNPAVSAKLRQMLPTLANRLQHRGFDARPIRVKLLNPG